MLEAIADADFVLFPPSNPVVSIGPILAVPGIRDAVAAQDRGRRLRDHRRRARPRHGRRLPDHDRRRDDRRRRRAHYGAELLNGWLVDEQDKAAADDPALAGIAVRALPLYMRDVPSTAAIAQAAIDLRPGAGPMTAGPAAGLPSFPVFPEFRRFRPATTWRG